MVLAALALPAIPTGDEPHFLIMTQSLLRDGDLDLRDNYARGDYLEYHPQPISDPHVVEIRGTWQPVHGIGLPILSLAWFAIAGRPAVVLMLTIMTAAAIGLTWSLLARLGFDRRSTNLAVLAGGLTLPLVSLSGQVFAEIPAVLLVALGLWAALDLRAGMSTLALLVTLVLLPWLHPKFIAVAIALLVSTAILQRDRASLRPLSLALFALATSVLGLVAFSYATYGSALPGGAIVVALSPRAEDWVGPMIGHFLAAPQVGLVGILFDQQSGLLIANPIYLLAVPGLVLLWRRDKRLALASGLVFLSIYLPNGMYNIWYGGFASPARLMVPAVPALTIMLAGALAFGFRRTRWVYAVLAVPACLHAYLVMTLPSFSRYGDPATDHNFFIAAAERATNLNLTLIFPELASSLDHDADHARGLRHRDCRRDDPRRTQA